MKKLPVILMLLLFTCIAGFTRAQKVTIKSFTVKPELAGSVTSWSPGDINAVILSRNPIDANDNAKMIIQVKQGGLLKYGDRPEHTTVKQIIKVVTGKEVKEILGQARLKPGKYSLCIQFFDVKNSALCDEVCREFTVAEPKPKEGKKK